MTQRYAWAEHFELSVDRVNELSQSVGPGEDALRVALRTGAIDQDAYLTWASEHYALPYATPAFFEAERIVKEAVALAAKHSAGASWSPVLFPISEWQGVLLVGCDAPPANIDPTYRLILTTSFDLARLWSNFESNFRSNFGSQNISEAVNEPAIEHDSQQIAEIDKPDGFSFDMPEGLSFSMDLSAPEGVALEGVGLTESTPMSEDTIPPTFSDFSAPFPSPQPPPLPPPTSLSSVSSSVSPSVSSSVSPSLVSPPPTPSRSMPPPLPPPTVLATAAAPPAPPAQPALRELPEFTSTDVKARPLELSQTGIHAKGTGEMNELGASPTARFTECKTYEQVCEIAFQQALTHFDRAMFLVFQGGQLKPWKWTERYQPKKERPDPIDLEPPSVFRIVYSTLLPYCGRVVMNKGNALFFDQCDGGPQPPFLTIVPILIDRQVAAMLMAAAESDTNGRSSLALMERMAEQMGSALKRIRGDKTQKAA